jgi:alpha-tubulin suppressor-like RCC1 family protein
MSKKTVTPDAAQELFRFLLRLQDYRGKSFLHALESPSSLSTAQALLKRASLLEKGALQNLLLQKDVESGYTPLHWAMMNGNLGAILLLLRHDSDRLLRRPINLLEDIYSGKDDLVAQMVSSVDHENMTALDLLGKLQRTSLRKCRVSLHQLPPYSSMRSVSTIVDEQDELALLNENMSLLEENCEEEQVSNNCACEVLTFGRANHCALGVADARSNHAQRVQTFALDTVGKEGSAVVVAAATHHTLVVTKNGHLLACGLGRRGRLGTGDERHVPLFVRITASLCRRKVVHAAAAENHSLCVTSDGSVYAFGSNRFGQLGSSGDRCFVPRRVEELKNCVQVAAGDKHSMALTRDGQVYTWGDNQAGQLGRRTGRVQRVDSLWNATPRKVASCICASEHSSLILSCPTAMGLPVNAVYSWGHGNHVPIKVNFSNWRGRHVNPVGIACAKYHNAAITHDGQVYTWGLHAEPLGTGSKSKQSLKTNSMVIASPQLVTGMLPENGGGIAVAVSASEHHTAVVTDCGHLYTWGATYGKDVLGHEGVRWQPNPKKVPGVHRAVGVAAAKEHNVMLVGTSFPTISPTLRESSLETLSARKVAKHVDLFNVIPILITAERIECTFLKEYCNEFIRLNLDGVLTLGRKSEMDCFLNEQLAVGRSLDSEDRDTECHPLLYDVITAGATSWMKETDSSAWMEACASLLESLPVSTLVKYRPLSDSMISSRRTLRRRSRAVSFHDERGDADASECSERCLMLTANMVLKTSDAAQSKVECLSKELRIVRKLLNQIAKLQNADSLTPEQQKKMGRKESLETDLRVLKPALENVEQRLRELKHEEEPSAVPSPMEVVKEEGTVKAFDASQDSVTAADTQVFRCEVCSISCPDSNNLALHKNGRKHRNRVLQAEEEEQKQVAASILEEKKRQMLLSDKTPQVSDYIEKKNPWATQTSVQPRYKLAPPPHFPSLEEAVTKPPPAQATKFSWSKPSAVVSTKAGPSAGSGQILGQDERKKTPKTGSTHFLSPGYIPPLKSPPWAVAHVSVARSLVTPQDCKKTYSLGDFLHSPSPPVQKPVAAPWSSSPKACAKKSTPDDAKSFLDIQQEEETFRTKQHCSVEGKWFIERKERAGSISAIQDAEAKDREFRLLLEEQKWVEKEIEREIQERNKARNRTPRKQNNKKAANANGGVVGKKSAKSGEGRKRRPNNHCKTSDAGGEASSLTGKASSTPVVKPTGQ